MQAYYIRSIPHNYRLTCVLYVSLMKKKLAAVLVKVFRQLLLTVKLCHDIRRH